MLPKLWSRLDKAERRVRRSFGTDITDPSARRWSRFHYHVFDHAFLRTFWTNFWQVAPGVWRSNQPTHARFEKYAAMGIRTVVNLRGEEKRAHYLFEEESCRKLGLKPAPIATQVVQRDIHAEFMTTVAIVGASIERWATEFRHLQRTEVLEAEEYFAKGQKGSSAMPHKRNPITGERLTGLARVLRGNAVAALENVALWHERDISHSSVERVIFPDSCTLLNYMLHKLTDLTKGLIVYPKNMEKNLGQSLGMWNSQSVLLALIRKGLTREESYSLVQRNAMETWKTKHDGRDDADFLKQLLSDPEVAKHFKKGELESICSTDFHYKHIKSRFKKLGL